ncbi:hypothetical protein EZV62_006451 [Acer yangbiense]|uniref:Bidirectional sugar transporter SWEET n=1 Tax=Acer yangbiense TaxID=1000413 RepID=A0A5C7I9W1_9ROSI|nr:hypothetical protein EZV62_006451 [Acer yangbiense]
MLNAYFWVWYGVVKPNSVLVATVNGFGAVLEIIYLIIFLLFAPTPRMRAKTGILAGVFGCGVSWCSSNVISLLLFASPIKTFWKVVKKKSTEDYKGVPYITTLMSTIHLCHPLSHLRSKRQEGDIYVYIYILIRLFSCVDIDTQLYICNVNGIQIKMAKLAAILDVGFLGTVIAITLLAMHKLSLRLTFVGVICAGLTIGMYGSPLLVMTTVIKTKSVEYMPFLISFFLFLNASAWSIYAVLVKDIYIGVPNSIGFVLGLAQLILYAIYKNKSKSTKSTDVMEEDGSAHLVKRSIEMRAYDHDDDVDDDGNKVMNDRILNKGTSLPKSSINRQYSLKKIIKTLSLGPYDVFPNWSNDAISNLKRNIDDDHP